MKLSKSLWIWLAVAVVLVATSTGYARFRTGSALPLHSSALEEVDAATVARATLAGESVAAVSNPTSAIIPHHLLAVELMGRLVGALRSAKPQTIVIIGLDHELRGQTRYTVSDQNWQSSLGILYTNAEVVRNLLTLPQFLVGNPVISLEHSVLHPLPFLQRRFPQAKFVLITVRGGLQTSKEQQLAEKLNEMLKPNDLVIASVDFSHYKDLARAQEEDAQSIAVLQKNDPQKLESIPADSSASLFVAMTFAKLRGAGAPTIINHKNSVDFTNQPNSTSTTSYITAVWGK